MIDFKNRDYHQMLSDFGCAPSQIAWLKKAFRLFWPKKTLQERYPQYRIGKGSYDANGNGLCVHSWGEGASLTIGAYCSIAEGVQFFLGGEHRTDWVTTYPFSAFWPSAKGMDGHPKTKGDIIIGNDVWIAADAIILSGVSIGDGAVVGAGSIVTKNVSSYSIVAGNPARVVEKRFDEYTIRRLQFVKWWEWDEVRIEKALPLLMSPNVEAFLLAMENLEI